MKNTVYTLIFIFPFMMGCTDINDSTIVQVSYGTSFGMCVGYCKHDMVLLPNQVTYTCSSWNNSLEPVTQTESLSATSWNSIKTDFNENAFFDLPETIGCPDCADGGAEWLEIKLVNGKIHKVTFEYNNEPEVLKNKIEQLRSLLRSKTCN